MALIRGLVLLLIIIQLLSFLRSWEGATLNPVQDHSLGTFQLTVKTKLRATSTIVAEFVEVLVYVSLRNVRVYDVRPIPTVTFNNQWLETQLRYEVQTKFQSEGPDDPVAPPTTAVLQSEPVEGDELAPEMVENTAQESELVVGKMCKLDIGRKFEYVITNVHDLLRRHVIIPQPASSGGFYKLGTGTAKNLQVYDFWRVRIECRDAWYPLFKGWSGHFKFRIFCYGKMTDGQSTVVSPLAAAYISDWDNGAGDAEGMMLMTPGGNIASSAYPAGIAQLETPEFGWFNFPLEMGYPVGATSSMIDVHVPFQSHLNFNMIEYETAYASGFENLNGSVLVRVPTGSSIEVFSAVGDDFRFHVFCPPITCTFKPIIYDAALGPPTLPTNIMGLQMPL